MPVTTFVTRTPHSEGSSEVVQSPDQSTMLPAAASSTRFDVLDPPIVRRAPVRGSYTSMEVGWSIVAGTTSTNPFVTAALGRTPVATARPISPLPSIGTSANVPSRFASTSHARSVLSGRMPSAVASSRVGP